MNNNKDKLNIENIVRRPRKSELSPIVTQVEKRKVSLRGPTSPLILVYSFFAFAIIGGILLSLPIASESNKFTSYNISLFTSISAITGTGLIVVSTDNYWSTFGEVVIGILIFVGGLGFITGIAFLLLLSSGHKLQNRMITRTGLGENRLGVISSMARNIILVAVFIQIVGSIIFFAKWNFFTPLWDGISFSQTLYQSIFLSISSFNNAGFEIFPDAKIGGSSLIGFSNDLIFLSTVSIMILLGSLSYATLANIISKKKFSLFSLDTKLVVIGTTISLLVGFISFFIIEFNNSNTIGSEKISAKISQSLFHSVNRTSGFSSSDYGNLSNSNINISALLMFIGGTTSSVAGGIKVNTLMIILIATYSIFRGKENISFAKRRINSFDILKSMAVGSTAIISIMILIILFQTFEPNSNYKESIFEVVSAFATCGWSIGETGNYGVGGQIILSIAMFTGRFGPITLVLFMSKENQEDKISYPEERVRVG
ncbi:MAG: TrkH family potassium uptake protein [Dehalococcoidia bacterium]